MWERTGYDGGFGIFDTDVPDLHAVWSLTARSLRVEKHRPTTCNPGTDGIIAYSQSRYQGGCLFITGDIPDLTVYNFDHNITSLRFVGSFIGHKQLRLYHDVNFQNPCDNYFQNWNWILNCQGGPMSAQVLDYTPPPIPTPPGTLYFGDAAQQATISPATAGTVVGGDLTTSFVGSKVGLSWSQPVTLHRIQLWGWNPNDNYDVIGPLVITFSDQTAAENIDMATLGEDCVDATFTPKTVTWVRIMDYQNMPHTIRGVEAWADTGQQISNNTCSNPQTLSSINTPVAPPLVLAPLPAA